MCTNLHQSNVIEKKKIDRPCILSYIGIGEFVQILLTGCDYENILLALQPERVGLYERKDCFRKKKQILAWVG